MDNTCDVVILNEPKKRKRITRAAVKCFATSKNLTTSQVFKSQYVNMDSHSFSNSSSLLKHQHPH